MRRSCAAVTTAIVLLAAGCGDATPAPQRTMPQPPATGGIDPHVLPPKSIPTHPTGRADPDAARVIRAWARAVRRGDFNAAARLFALPAKFQNGTPVLTLRDRVDVLAVTAGFSCGAVVTHVASAGFYTLVRFRLTARTGGNCQGAEGNTTGGAIRVVHGHIRAWYRLYDPEEIAPQREPVDPNDTKA